MLVDPTHNAEFQFRLLRSMPGAELVTYKPVGGPPRKVWALVNRQPAAEHYASELARQSRAMVTVVNDAHRGIATADVDPGGDRVAVALRIGDAPQDLQLTGEPELQDAGLVTFTLR